MLDTRLEINLLLLKDLLGLNSLESNKDEVLEHYLNKAEQSIKNYLNYKDDEFIAVGDKFDTQIVDLAKYFHINRKSTGISQQSQGSRSQSFEKGIPLEIKDSLPMPRIRVVG